jgi:hypothetical protein
VDIQGSDLWIYFIEEGRGQVKVRIKHLAIFFLFSQQEVSADIIQIQLLETSPQKQKEQ